MQQRKKWRMKSRNLIAGIIQFLKNCNGKLKQTNFTLTFCLTLLENHLHPNKRKRRFRLQIIRVGEVAYGAIIQMIALNKPFVFLVPLLRLYYPIYNTNLKVNISPFFLWSIDENNLTFL